MLCLAWWEDTERVTSTPCSSAVPQSPVTASGGHGCRALCDRYLASDIAVILAAASGVASGLGQSPTAEQTLPSPGSGSLMARIRSRFTSAPSPVEASRDQPETHPWSLTASISDSIGILVPRDVRDYLLPSGVAHKAPPSSSVGASTPASYMSFFTCSSVSLPLERTCCGSANYLKPVYSFAKALLRSSVALQPSESPATAASLSAPSSATLSSPGLSQQGSLASPRDTPAAFNAHIATDDVTDQCDSITVPTRHPYPVTSSSSSPLSTSSSQTSRCFPPSSSSATQPVSSSSAATTTARDPLDYRTPTSSAISDSTTISTTTTISSTPVLSITVEDMDEHDLDREMQTYARHSSRGQSRGHARGLSQHPPSIPPSVSSLQQSSALSTGLKSG